MAVQDWMQETKPMSNRVRRQESLFFYGVRPLHIVSPYDIGVSFAAGFIVGGLSVAPHRTIATHGVAMTFVTPALELIQSLSTRRNGRWMKSSIKQATY